MDLLVILLVIGFVGLVLAAAYHHRESLFGSMDIEPLSRSVSYSFNTSPPERPIPPKPVYVGGGSSRIRRSQPVSASPRGFSGGVSRPRYADDDSYNYAGGGYGSGWGGSAHGDSGSSHSYGGSCSSGSSDSGGGSCSGGGGDGGGGGGGGD